jgi:type IV pilus assembly protein PilM
MFNLFGAKGKLGVDIGTSSIKVVEVEKSGGRFKLTNYGIFELKGFSDSSGSHVMDNSILKLPDDEITWGIKEILSKAGIRSENVVASVPSFSTFTTVIEMPYLSDADFTRTIPLEAKKYIPIPIDDVVLDWSIVGVKGDQTNQKIPSASTNVEVFLAAVPKAETVRYQNIMRNCGLMLKALELENSSLIRALLGNDLSPAAIINIGGRSTSILIVNKGYERVSHNYEIGGFEITKSISRSLNVSFEKAEELKRQYGLNPVNENAVQDAMSSLVDMMAFEARKTITNFEDTTGQKVSQIVLTGGLTNMPNFTEYFKNRMGREVYSGSVFSRVMFNKDLEPAINELSGIFSVALGLAMRDI